MDIEDFKHTTPQFIPQTYFNGKMTAYGLVKNWRGQIIRRFKADLIGDWDENGVGRLQEYFLFDDGEKQERIWRLKPLNDIDDNNFIATANDVVGEGKLIARGHTVLVDYILRVPYNNSTIDVHIEDWLHLQEDGVIINHSKMKKFGITVGELVITIIKADD